ncbi:phosphoribosylformylglycinamidine synthase subunit PurQ [Candidatus Woesearchaeota archaeon]|nr:phosphoribosylformylglycinamidine synthase subunit PurQ [Candidatus Woesearchaeota archaeon]
MAVNTGKTRPIALLMSGYGINCERETAHAFDKAGARTQIAHINDVIAKKSLIAECQILVWPGGFSMGDDTGSGLSYAHYARDNLRDELQAFIKRGDTLSLGICNGFQIMTHLGFFPVGKDVTAEDYLTGEAVKTALTFNTSARYRDLWVDLCLDPALKCRWTSPGNVNYQPIPIAHGEGRFYASPETLAALKEGGQVVFRYADKDGDPAAGGPENPNGSVDDIAGICDPSGRFLGMMPHPERAIYTFQNPAYTKKRELAVRKGIDVPDETRWMELFRNAVKYFD